MTFSPDLDELLRLFRQLGPRSPLNVPYHAYFPGLGPRKTHLLVGFLTHGNEKGSLPAALRLVEELAQGKWSPQGPTSFLLGNVEAARKDLRFLEEDFNRVFTFDRPAESLERKRAEQVRPLLDQVDFFLDVHQTQTPTQSAFWTFPWSRSLGSWARIIKAAPRGLTRAPGGVFSPGKCCLDEYVRDRGKTGLTVELGNRGWDAEQAENCYRGVRRLVEAYDAASAGASLDELARREPEISWFETFDVFFTPTPEYRLREGLGCFTQVQRGELLSAPGSPEIRASDTGWLLFPKYPPVGQAPPPELFRLARPLKDPETHFGPAD